MDTQPTSSDTPASPEPNFSQTVVSKVSHPWGKIVAMVLLILALMAGAAYGGYYYEHMRATGVEQQLNKKIQNLESSSVPDTQTSTNLGKPLCITSGLGLSAISTNGAAGTTGITYAVTNISGTPCSLDGGAEVTLADAKGKQLGDAAGLAADQQQFADERLILEPNKEAYITVLFPNADNFQPGECSAEAATIRITPNAETTPLQIAIGNQHNCPGFATQAFTTTAP